MRKALLTLFFCTLVCPAFAQTTLVHAWPDGTAPLNRGWKTHAGDDPAWASLSFDDSSWETIANLDAPAAENIRFATPGFRWYRIHLRIEGSPDRLALGLFAPEAEWKSGSTAGRPRHTCPTPSGPKKTSSRRWFCCRRAYLRGRVWVPGT